MADKPIKSRVLKTYSRARKRPASNSQDEENTKRRRVIDELPITRPKPRPFSTMEAWLQSSRTSTPTSDLPSSDGAIFSDNPADPTATPPSSPPPLLPALPSVAVTESNPTACNESEDRTDPLRPISSNLRRSANPALKKAIESQMLQMQINLGANLQKTCKDCGMTYVRSSTEDSALHDKYHTRDLNGVDLGKPFRKWAETRQVWRGRDGALVVPVDRTDKSFERRKACEVLDIVQTELGAVDIGEQELWSRLTEGYGIEAEQRGRYRAFMYLVGLKCVGLCLAKHIRTARRVVEHVRTDADEGFENRGLLVSEEVENAMVGISRIWTSKSHRGRGIAGLMLGCVARNFHPKGPVQKTQIAFSQPTTSGTALARRWMGQEYGWLVYVD